MKCINYQPGDEIDLVLPPVKAGTLTLHVGGKAARCKEARRWRLGFSCISVLGAASAMPEVAVALISAAEPDYVVVQDKELQARKSVNILLNYPLEVQAMVCIGKPLNSCWTSGYILWAIARAYRRIYEKERESPGTYGIWGHQLGDLVFESLSYYGRGRMDVGLGS